MKITLTGATGFIGSRLVKRLLTDGHDITVLTRRARSGTGVRYLVWNSDQDDAPIEAFEQCDAVIHLLGEPVAQRWTDAVKDRIRRSRTEGTRRLINTLTRLDRKPSVLVSASAVGIYGSRGDELLTESSLPAHGFLADVTVEWEREARRAEALGVRVVPIRIGVVLGADGGALKAMVPIFRAGIAGPLGSGKQWMSWIHVDDLVEMVVFALTQPTLHSPVNGTAPEPVTNKEFTRLLAHQLHRPAFMPVPEFALKLLYGEMASVTLASQRVVPEAARRAGFHFRYPTLPEALAVIFP